MTKSEFVKEIAKDAKTVCKERGYGYASYATCVAQACCESAYGQSERMSKANAYFGIKATAKWVQANKYGGLTYNSRTKECYQGVHYDITACFRAYLCRLDSVKDYFDLMEISRYKNSLKASTVEECITIIKKGGYATAPDYINTILKVYNNIKEQIDQVWGDKIVVIPSLSIEEIAKEVIDGKHGNGSIRKANLERLGYKYDEVQAKVNEIIRLKELSIEKIAQEVIDGKYGNGSIRKTNIEKLGYKYDEVQAKVNEILRNKKSNVNDNVEKLLNIARKELGTKEYPENSNNVKYNTDYYGREVSGSAYPWCCAFVWWVFKKAGMSKIFCDGKKTALCEYVRGHMKNHTMTPQPGDLAIYQFDSDPQADHIGIVESVNADGSFVAIEGNTRVGNDSNGGEVMRRNRKKSSVICFVRPNYEEV